MHSPPSPRHARPQRRGVGVLIGIAASILIVACFLFSGENDANNEQKSSNAHRIMVSWADAIKNDTYQKLYIASTSPTTTDDPLYSTQAEFDFGSTLSSYPILGRPTSSKSSVDAEKCSPTPWLLPASAAAVLPYQGLHNDLDGLARTQARSIDSYKAVSVLFFNYHQSVMTQNAIYSLVKWSQVCNYIVVVWDEPSLEVCQSLNLPCFNATDLAPSEIGVSKEAFLHSPDYVKITWMKPILVAELLQLGYVVHASDIDIAYAPSDLTLSYLKYINSANATAAFQREGRYPFVVNTGNYMILPTEEGKILMKKWLERAEESMKAREHEQTALGKLYHEEKDAFLVCQSPEECKNAHKRASSLNKPVAIVRRTSNSWFLAFGETCITKTPERMTPVHPCAFPTAYFHAVCVIGSAAKTRALKGAGFWFLDDGDDSQGCPVDEENEHVVRCRPLVERIPEVEVDFNSCPRERMVFQYYQTLYPAAARVDPAKYLPRSSSSKSSSSSSKRRLSPPVSRRQLRSSVDA